MAMGKDKEIDAAVNRLKSKMQASLWRLWATMMGRDVTYTGEWFTKSFARRMREVTRKLMGKDTERHIILPQSMPIAFGYYNHTQVFNRGSSVAIPHRGISLAIPRKIVFVHNTSITDLGTGMELHGQCLVSTEVAAWRSHEVDDVLSERWIDSVVHRWFLHPVNCMSCSVLLKMLADQNKEEDSQLA